VAAFYLKETEYLKWMADHHVYKLVHYRSLAELGPVKDADRSAKAKFLSAVTLQYERNLAADRTRCVG
jgi:hypothetical protein